MTGYLKWFVVPAAAGLLWSVPMPVSAQAQPETTARDQPATTAEDQALVDMFFKDKIIAVRRSRDTADDVELIAEILAQAANVPDSPAVQWLMYETAVDLGMDSEVYGAAIDAVMAMREAFPEADAMSDESLLVLMEQAYRSARRTDRPDVAGPYLELMLKVALSVEADGDVDRAGRMYRTGASVARAVRSEQEAVFEAEVRRLNEIEQLNARIRQLASALEANPRNSGAARELTMLFVLEKHDMVAAAEVVELTRDPDLVDAVTMGVDGPAQTGAAEALRVGDWYYALSQEHADHTVYLLGESLAFYDQFLRVYDRDDALRSRVSTMRVLVERGLAEADEQAADEQRGTWVDALSAFNAREHTLRGDPEVDRGELHMDEASVAVPFDASEGYDLRLRMLFVEGDDGLIMYLPLGAEEGALLWYSKDGHETIQLRGAEQTREKGYMLTPGREVELIVEVRPRDAGAVDIAIKVDGEVCLRWAGSPDELDVPRGARPPQDKGNVLYIRTYGEFIFKELHVRQPRD